LVPAHPAIEAPPSAPRNRPHRPHSGDQWSGGSLW
jgi:hypothetical protein